MALHQHFPQHVVLETDDNRLGLCLCGQVAKLSRYNREIGHNMLIVQWDMSECWRFPTEDELALFDAEL